MNRPELALRWENSESVGLAHICLSVNGSEQVDQLTERLRTDGYEVVSGPRVTGDGYYESVVRGPEGLLIELTP